MTNLEKKERNLVPLHKRLKKKDVKKFVTCRICGKKHKNLVLHILLKHEITCREYKDIYPDAGYLLSDDIRVKFSVMMDRFIREKNRYVTDDEIRFIRDNYPAMTKKDIAEKLGIPLRTVDHSVEKYCTKRKHRIRKTTDEEIEYVINNYNTIPGTEIAEHLGRSYGFVRRVAAQYGITRQELFAKNSCAVFYSDGAPEPLCNEEMFWINKEMEYCRENYKNKTVTEISRFLGRSETAVRVKMKRMKLRQVRYWSEEETDYLKKNYNVQSIEIIADRLNRSVSAVKNKAGLCGLKRGD